MAPRRQPRLPDIGDLLEACEKEGQARFFDRAKGSVLSFGVVIGSGKIVVVQAGLLGDEEHPILAEIREARGIAFLVSRDMKGQRVFLRGALADVPMKDGETILDTHARSFEPGQRVAGMRIPGTSVDVEYLDGRMVVGSAGGGVAGGVQVPKLDEVRRAGEALLGQFFRGR